MGFTFVLDRDTGAAVVPGAGGAVPQSTVPGEEAWPTQLIPLKPPPLVRQSLTEADLTNITPESHAYALKQFRQYRSGSIYTPPSLQGTITTPGHLGGAEWHGATFDPVLNVLVRQRERSPDDQSAPARSRHGRRGAEPGAARASGSSSGRAPPATAWTVRARRRRRRRSWT